MDGNPTEIRVGYVPGALGRIVELHETYYADEWELEYEFAREVAVELAEFIDRYDETTDRLWLASDGDEILGSIVIDGGHGEDEDGARLRWFILSPHAQGQGVGTHLVEEAMAFCEARYDRVYLWTYAGLDAARHLYERHGFELAEEHEADDWGPTLTHLKFAVDL